VTLLEGQQVCSAQRHSHVLKDELCVSSHQGQVSAAVQLLLLGLYWHSLAVQKMHSCGHFHLQSPGLYQMKLCSFQPEWLCGLSASKVHP